MFVYTDAPMYDGAKTPAGMVGIVIYDPEDPEHRWRYASGLCAECAVGPLPGSGGRLGVACARGGGLSARGCEPVCTFGLCFFSVMRVVYLTPRDYALTRIRAHASPCC